MTQTQTFSTNRIAKYFENPSCSSPENSSNRIEKNFYNETPTDFNNALYISVLIVSKTAKGITYNKYAFCNNNPWRYTDPEGKDAYLINTGGHIDIEVDVHFDNGDPTKVAVYSFSAKSWPGEANATFLDKLGVFYTPSMLTGPKSINDVKKSSKTKTDFFKLKQLKLKMKNYFLIYVLIENI